MADSAKADGRVSIGFTYSRREKCARFETGKLIKARLTAQAISLNVITQFWNFKVCVVSVCFGFLVAFTNETIFLLPFSFWIQSYEMLPAKETKATHPDNAEECQQNGPFYGYVEP